MTGRRVSRLNPPDEWIHRDVSDLRIVDDDLWDRAQTRLAAIRTSGPVAKARATDVLDPPSSSPSPDGKSGLRRLRRGGRADRQGLYRLLRCPEAGNMRQSRERSSKPN